MVFESNTLDFLWLQDGNQGSASGEGLYTWVKYSHNADGSDLSDDPTDMEYIGFAYNKTERIESEDPNDYEWCKIKGNDGEPGTDGYTIILDNENISFTTSSLKIPLNDQTATCKVIVYQGTEPRTNFLIGEITAPIGINVRVENKIIYLSVSTSTAIGLLSGSIDIPIQIDGIDFHKKICYSLALKGEDGDSPVSVYLSNENHTFSATSDGKAIASRIQTNVYAYYGSTPVAATVGNLTPPTGMKIDIVNNGQANTFLNISVDSTLSKNGVLDIPVTVGENTYYCSFSYTLSPQGADGTPAKAIDVTPSSQVFKSTDGGTTFSPDKITITPRIQGDIEYSKWQYSTDGGKTWIDVTTSTNGLSISSTILSIAKSSTLYTNTITSIVFKCISNDPNYYDTCTISKLYDVVDIKSDIDAEIQQVKETISGVESKADKANKSITDKVWQSDITTTVNNYDNTTGKTVRDRVSKVETNLEGITSTVQDMQTTVTEKADQSTVTELTNRVSKSEQDVSGFKQTVENTYAKQSDLEDVNKYAKTSFEQLSDKFSWIVTSQSSETSLTLTDSLISAVTKQFIIKDTNGSATIIEGGKIKANAITTQMLASDAIKSTNYAEGTYTDGAGYSKIGTFIDLKTGMIHTPSFYTNKNGDAYISGHIVAKAGNIGGCSILDGILNIPSANITGTLNASQIRIGDYTNYHDLTIDTYEKYGFTLVNSTITNSDGTTSIEQNNPWFQHTPKRDISICPVEYDTYKCQGGETFLIEYELSSTVRATKSDKYGDNSYIDVNVGLYVKKSDGNNGWYIPFGCRSDSTGTIQKVSTTITLGNDVRSFSTFIQCDGNGTLSGTLKIRNISVRRMVDNSLLLNGSVTLDKITSDNIVGENGWINLKNGTFDYGNGSFAWDGTQLKINGGGEFTGKITATSITANETYSISCLVKDHDETSGNYLAPEEFIRGHSYKYKDYQGKEAYAYNRQISIYSPEEREGDSIKNTITKSAEILLESYRYNGNKNGTSEIILNADSITTTCDIYLGSEVSNKEVYKLYGNVEGDVTGNATSASKLQTSRNLKIGNSSKSFDGSANVTWTLSEIGASSSNHTHSSLVGGDYNVIFTGAENFYPRKGTAKTNGSANIGLSNARFQHVYITGNVNSSSDKNEKHDILDLDERYENMFMDLRPVTYMWNKLSEFDNSIHDRVHCGLIAQEVNEAALKNGLSSMTFAGICRDELDTPTFDGRTERWGLAYNEFTAITIKMVQKSINGISQLNEEISNLKQENEKLKNALSKIETLLSSNNTK